MTWTLYGKTFNSHFLLGSANYPSLETLKNSLELAQVEIVTVSLRRQMVKLKEYQEGHQEKFWDLLLSLPLTFLPNTAGCFSVKEAVTTAHMAREIFKTNWIKLEVIGDDYTLAPDPFNLLEASKILISEGFQVFPYMTEDLILADALLQAGCQVLMPWGSPIGSGKGLNNIYGLKLLRQKFPQVPMIIDAGIGLPSHALMAIELGFDGVLLNTAVSHATQPALMAKAFAQIIEAGVWAKEAGPMTPRDFASPSTPTIGQPFWHLD